MLGPTFLTKKRVSDRDVREKGRNPRACPCVRLQTNYADIKDHKPINRVATASFSRDSVEGQPQLSQRAKGE
jgi:hypothetical protein